MTDWNSTLGRLLSGILIIGLFWPRDSDSSCIPVVDNVKAGHRSWHHVGYPQQIKCGEEVGLSRHVHSPPVVCCIILQQVASPRRLGIYLRMPATHPPHPNPSYHWTGSSVPSPSHGHTGRSPGCKHSAMVTEWLVSSGLHCTTVYCWVQMGYLTLISRHLIQPLRDSKRSPSGHGLSISCSHHMQNL